MKRFVKIVKWLYPGLKIKRWVSLAIIGFFFILFFSIRFFTEVPIVLRIFNVCAFVFAFVGFVVAVKQLIRSVLEAIYPEQPGELIDVIYEKRFLSKGPKIVAIGGGHGLSAILEGLKRYTSNITAIVTVADEGGSSGRLREEFNILPPGDIRNCLVSLAEASQLMRNLFQYRFAEGGGIKGHSFGNLFITAMTQVTGSFQEAIEESSKVLAIRGCVVPSTLENIRIKAEYDDGTIKEGEDKIPDENKIIKKLLLNPSDVKANPDALTAIRNADIIIMGPGSLFTSVIPNLLIKEIRDEIIRRSVMKAYICNVMTQAGETDGFTVADHVQAIIEHSHKHIINCVIVNSGRMQHKLLLKYAQERSFPIIFDRERLRKMGLTILEADVIGKHDYLRHDSLRVAKTIIYNFNTGKHAWKKFGKILS